MFAARDLTFAFILHLLVVAVLLLANQWHVSHPKIPERVVQVKMVTLQELQDMMHQPKPKPQKVVPAKPKVKPQPASKPKPVKPKPVINPKPKPREKKVVEEELDYDPFAPLESKPKKVVEKKISGKKALQDMLQSQLTDAEVNRYIAGMQRAVEQQWKVPTEMIGKVVPALVELKLLHNGQVSSVRILESTGSKQLDNTLIQAIYAAAPFDVPSQQFELFKTNQIRFHPLQ